MDDSTEAVSPAYVQAGDLPWREDIDDAGAVLCPHLPH
jgi:hypothetical protein